eukprot:TRINITY_DN10483_c0_g1_i1.p1 TRINITY_DN10483_c0_g1~~TRINITY_DN10483_c0_g1_i1.p1  ORF type:complete len:368 (-),score=108.93 TRINITY_DN10483_c0_g1_i1:8-1111(-)
MSLLKTMPLHPIVWRETGAQKKRQELADSAEANRPRAANSKFDNQMAIFESESDFGPAMVMHPTENYVIVADAASRINIWNFASSECVNRFSNCNPPGTLVTSLNIANTHEQGLLLAGSTDGVVRVWKSADDPAECRLLTAWRTLTDLQPTAAMVTDWQQEEGYLFTAFSPLIRLWDVERSQLIQDITTGPEGAAPFVCSMCHDRLGPRMLMAGCSDGSVRTYDWRVQPKLSLVHMFREHKGQVFHVSSPCFPSVNNNTLIVSGTLSGEVKIWDTRAGSSVQSFVLHSSGMKAMAVHPYAPIIATGTQSQKILISNFEGKELNSIKYYDGFLGQRIGPVTSLAFHPYKMYLACTSSDRFLSMYQSSV